MGGELFRRPIESALFGRGDRSMDYFAGLDISMNETHICVVDRDGRVALEAKAPSSPGAIAAELVKGPATKRIVFETGRMAPALYHGLDALGLPVVCIESRQAYQALKSLATHKTDRNDARGLAHLARTGFFKPVHVKSLPAHALRSLIIARKKLVGQRVTLENQIRGRSSNARTTGCDRAPARTHGTSAANCRRRDSSGESFTACSSGSGMSTSGASNGAHSSGSRPISRSVFSRSARRWRAGVSTPPNRWRTQSASGCNGVFCNSCDDDHSTKVCGASPSLARNSSTRRDL